MVPKYRYVLLFLIIHIIPFAVGSQPHCKDNYHTISPTKISINISSATESRYIIKSLKTNMKIEHDGQIMISSSWIEILPVFGAAGLLSCPSPVGDLEGKAKIY